MTEYTACEQAYRNGLEAGKPKWISVAEQLPNFFVDVLIFSELDGVCVDFYNGEDFAHCDVTHWMPQPEPPKGV